MRPLDQEKLLLRSAAENFPQFLQRSRVLSLYRNVLRETRKIQDPSTRDETRVFARQEIERHRNVEDIVSLVWFALIRSPRSSQD